MMKRILLALWVAITIAGNPALAASSIPASPVAHTIWQLGASSSANSPTMDTTGANWIGVWVASASNPGTAPLTDNKGNTFSVVLGPSDQSTGGMAWLGFYTCNMPCTTGAGHVFTGSALFATYEIDARSGVLSSGSFDSGAQAVTGSNSATSIQPGSSSPSVDGSLLMTGATNFNTSGTTTISGGSYSVQDQLYTAQQQAGTLGLSVSTYVQGAKTAVNPTYTMPGAQPVSIYQIVIKPASYTPPGGGKHCGGLGMMGVGC